MKQRVFTLTVFIGLIWAISIYEIFFYPDFLIPVLVPRTADGLLGILTMPFLHGDLNHLVCNTLPLLIFSWLILNRGSTYFLKATSIIILIGGLLVWLLARSAAHIGASGVVFGYFGFLIARSFYDSSPRSIIITLLVILFYGSIIWGVLPTSKPISWEGHLFGLIAGIFTAKSLQHKTGQVLV